MKALAREGFTQQDERVALACIAAALTVAGVILVNPSSIAQYVYYLVLWCAFIACFHRDELGDFCFAYLVNSAFIAAFFVGQTLIYPDSYGTTSPLGSWTDDSFFFALVADDIPNNLFVRDSYYEYTHPFAVLIRTLSLLKIDHPMDAVFFQSGTAAMMATFSKRYTFQVSADKKLAETVYALVLVCPFLMMNGGVILIRDTLAAALLIYCLCCLNDRRFALAFSSFALQILIRPGTGFILIPVLIIIFLPEVRQLVRRYYIALTIGAIALWFGFERLADAAPDMYLILTDHGAVGILGRNIIDDLIAQPDSNRAFLALQELPFLLRFILNGCYIFLYPFLSFNAAFASEYFDIRGIALNFIAPIYAFWLNAWFIAGVIASIKASSRQRQIAVAVIAALLLIGTYSLQTRHKTIIYPLYYFVIAIGMRHAPQRARRTGYWCSSLLIALQLGANFR